VVEVGGKAVGGANMFESQWRQQIGQQGFVVGFARAEAATL
jgi:hypothetical protein